MTRLLSWDQRSLLKVAGYTDFFTVLPSGAGFFPATNNQALSALARARTVQISETTRKLLTNDSSIAFLSATCVSLLTLVGGVIAASLTRCISRLASNRREMQRGQVALKTAREDREDDKTEYRDGQQPGYAGHSIIDPRSDTRVALLYRAHDRCRERSDGDGHAQAHHHHSREKGGPETAWATCDTWHSKESKAKRGDDRANHQRQLRAKAIH